jgi:ParB family chromosome partitioning protein
MPNASVRQVSPDQISPNPENPRLIFREHELKELQDSIASQGILVPLTVYESKRRLIILDGERRWRCARRLGLSRLPVIVQPEPTRMQNIMMMFAIHNARKEWDPLPTAYKLRDLEGLYREVEGRDPNEIELAQLASISRGEVRRLKSLLALPQRYLDELMKEAEKPRSEQQLTVDHVLEATRGVQALRKRDIIDSPREEDLRAAIVDKYKSGVIRNTVEPRKLARIARAVEREEIPVSVARRASERLIGDPHYSVDDAFRDTVEQADFEHSVEQLANRLTEKLEIVLAAQRDVGPGLRQALLRLGSTIRRIAKKP